MSHFVSAGVMEQSQWSISAISCYCGNIFVL